MSIKISFGRVFEFEETNRVYTITKDLKSI